jgi:hypothetical protein
MRNFGGAGPSDNCANPAKRGEDHIDHGPCHEDLKRAVPIAQLMVNHAKYAINHTEHQPGDYARGQEIPGPAKKPKNGDRRKKNKNSSASDIALKSKPFQQRNLVGYDQPGSKHQTQTNSRVNAGANGRIAKEIQPA